MATKRPHTRRILAPALGVMLVTLLGACGMPQRPAVPSSTLDPVAIGPLPPDQAPTVDPQYEGLEIDWSGAQNGLSVASIEKAKQYLLFEPPFEPRGLGIPKTIYVSREPSKHVKTQITFVYDTDAYGRVLVIMGIDQLTVEQRRASNAQQLSYNDRPRRTGDRSRSEIVTIRGGTEAGIGISPRGRATIIWQEGPASKPIRIWVSGPTLTRDQVIEIAEKL